jgi:hypothetical protein
MEATVYRKILDAACARLEALGIAVNLENGPPVTASRISQCEQEWGVAFPSCVRQFYMELGDGLRLQWFIHRSNISIPFGSLWVPRLAEMKMGLDFLRMLSECFADYDFLDTEQPEVARRHYQRQLSFFPFLEENSDLICIETIGDRETVVYFDHEWPCYGRGDSGLFLADSLPDFWMGWSSVGFVRPKLSWWPGTVGERGTEWTEARFGFSLPLAAR